ncbi:MAG: ComF family protein [Desulfobacteraceae bacterium]|nr:ComF family protein [Desulfobacteraceae bacterium]
MYTENSPKNRLPEQESRNREQSGCTEPRSTIAHIGAGLRLAGQSLLDLCFPKVCAGCGRTGDISEGFWCGSCLDSIPWIASPLCPRCGRPFTDSPDSPDHFCGECLKSAFHFDAARSALLHSGVVRERVHEFKFGGRLERLPPLSELLRSAYRSSGFPRPDLVLPVPLHVRRLKERGFNQSGLLAREFSRKSGLEVSHVLLARRHWTEPQTRLNRRQRLKNVRGAFEVHGGMDVKGGRVLLVDDVYTTGSTLSECARALKKAGVREVFALTVTRALPD